MRTHLRNPDAFKEPFTRSVKSWRTLSATLSCVTIWSCRPFPFRRGCRTSSGTARPATAKFHARYKQFKVATKRANFLSGRRIAISRRSWLMNGGVKTKPNAKYFYHFYMLLLVKACFLMEVMFYGPCKYFSM